MPSQRVSPTRRRMAASGREEQPEPTELGPGTRSSFYADRSWQRIGRYGMVVAIGYLVGGRSFSYIGIAKLNLFIGELSLLLAFLHPRARLAFKTAVAMLWRPGRWHVLVVFLTLLLVLGLFEVVRGVSNGSNILTALKELPFNYYPLLLPVGLWIGQRNRHMLERFAWGLAVANAVYGVATQLFLSKVHVNLPGSAAASGGAVPLFAVNTGSGMAIIALLAFPLPPRWRRWTPVLLLANGFVLFAEQQRSELLGFVVALFLFYLLKGRLRTFFKAGLVAVVLLGLVGASGIKIGGSSTRGGQVSLAGIVGRVIAPVDHNLSTQLVGTMQSSTYAGTANWRTTWWSAIWRSSHENIPTAVFGHGYGYPLQQLGVNVPVATRTPHDIFFYALGYSGWVGVAIFFGLWLYLLRMLYLVYRRTGNPFGLAFVTVAFGLGLFGDWFETPYGAAPTYFIVGMALAPLGGFIASRSQRRMTPGQSETLRVGSSNGLGPESTNGLHGVPVLIS